MSGHGRLGLTDQRRGGRILLPASPPATVAQLPILADGDMSSLAGCDTAPQSAAQNQSASNAGAQRYHRQILTATARAAKKLAHSSTVRIIAQQQRHIEMLSEQLDNRDILHGNIGDKEDRVMGNCSWEPHTYTGNLLRANGALAAGLRRPGISPGLTLLMSSYSLSFCLLYTSRFV